MFSKKTIFIAALSAIFMANSALAVIGPIKITLNNEYRTSSPVIGPIATSIKLDKSDIKKTGTILDGLEIPRGLIEFVADEATPLYNPALKKDAEIILICGVGGQAALAGKTLIEMGYENVLNVGGIPEWEKNGGPMKK